MIGDGVYDVPALKAAQLAIAQGSGAQMAKSVSDLVLVDGDFAVIPGLIAQGRQMLRNLQRVAKLFLSHPPTQDRIRKTQAEIRKLNPERSSYVLNTSDFETIRKRLYDHLM